MVREGPVGTDDEETGLQMNQPKTLEIDGVGKVLFEPSRRARRLNVSVRPFRGVRVAVPRRTSLQKARAFVCSQLSWIQKHVEKTKQLEKEYELLSRQTARIDDREANGKIVRRLDELAGFHGFSYSRVFVRNLKSRWGSCSHRNHISLNRKLVLLPEEMLDYVILHELVHTRIKNHSSEFWQEMDRLTGDARTLNLNLQQYSAVLAAG
jgi:predicted metal-dependent hydrolase